MGTTIAFNGVQTHACRVSTHWELNKLNTTASSWKFIYEAYMKYMKVYFFLVLITLATGIITQKQSIQQS